MKFPVHRLFTVLKTNSLFADKCWQMIFVAAEIAEFGGVLQGEFQRFQGVIKTDEPKLTRNVPRAAQNCERVRGRTEANIPNHKFADVILQSLAQSKLMNIKPLGFRHRPDDRMKRLGIHKRPHGANTVVEANELIVVGHGLKSLTTIQ